MPTTWDSEPLNTTAPTMPRQNPNWRPPTSSFGVGLGGGGVGVGVPNTSQVIRPLSGSRGGAGTFSADQNLLSSQFNPTDSRSTTAARGRSEGAQDALSNFTFSPFQSVAGPDYSRGSAMIQGATDANGAMRYDFTQANQQRQNGINTLSGAKAEAERYLQNAGGMSAAGFSGGGASQADTSALNRAAADARGYVGDKFDYGADVGEARGMTLSALKKAMDSPDRTALAAEAMRLFEERSQPGFEMAERDLARNAAAMGRRGSGLVNSEFADLGTSRERTLSQARTEAALKAAGETMADRLNLTSAAQGVTQGLGAEDRAKQSMLLSQAGSIMDIGNSQFAGEALNAQLREAAAGRAASGAQAYASNQRGIASDLYGMGRDRAGAESAYGDSLEGQEVGRVGLGERQSTFLRDSGRDFNNLEDRRVTHNVGERDAARADEYGQFDATTSRANTLSAELRNREGRDFNDRNEMRTERDYQTGRSDRAVEDERQRMLDEEMLRNGRYSRGMGYANLGYGAPSPIGQYNQNAQNYGNQANQWGQAASGMLEEWFAGQQSGQRRTGAGTGRPTTTPFYGYDSNGEPLTQGYN